MTMIFDHFGTPTRGRVVMSVPHAGCDYPQSIIDRLAVGLRTVRMLEDRHADVLAAQCIAQGRQVFIARTPRLLIDLNRAETDFDPAIILGGTQIPSRPTPRARSGLGLVPHRLNGVGALWTNNLLPAELVERIQTVHRPYHRALADALANVHALHGVAVLVDLHSMPSLSGHCPADIVIGDRHGSTASREITAAIERVCLASGLRTAHNAPYAGGYIIERHAQPDRGVFAVQLEFDRRLYLDSGNTPIAAASELAITVERIVSAIDEAVREQPILQAAE